MAKNSATAYRWHQHIAAYSKRFWQPCSVYLKNIPAIFLNLFPSAPLWLFRHLDTWEWLNHDHSCRHCHCTWIPITITQDLRLFLSSRTLSFSSTLASGLWGWRWRQSKVLIKWNGGITWVITTTILTKITAITTFTYYKKKCFRCWWCILEGTCVLESN